MDILFLKDYSTFNNYEKQCNKRGFSYINSIKREQNFLYTLIKHKYKKCIIDDNMRVLVYIHADFGNRQSKDYKIIKLNTKDYKQFMETDDYSDLFSIKQFLNCYSN